MIRQGQETRFASEAAEEKEKLNSVDVSQPDVLVSVKPCSPLTIFAELVTEVDKAVEAFIVKRITETYPQHKLYVSTDNAEGRSRSEGVRSVSERRATKVNKSPTSRPGS